MLKTVRKNNNYETVLSISFDEDKVTVGEAGMEERYINKAD